MTLAEIEEQFLAKKRFEFFYKGDCYVIFQRNDEVYLFERVDFDQYIIPSFVVKREVFKFLKDGSTIQDIEEQFVVSKLTNFFYEGIEYIVFQSRDMPEQKFLFEQTGIDKYALSPKGVQKLNFLLNDYMLEWIEFIKSRPVHLPSEEEEETEEKNTKKSWKQRLLNSFAAFSLIVALLIAISYHMKENIYEGIDCEALLEQIPEELPSCREILEGNFNELSKDSIEAFSEQEREELIRRIERFASYLGEEELAIFKYQLSRTEIKKVEYDGDYGVQYHLTHPQQLLFERSIEKCNYRLERIFCTMITNCYLDQDDQYFIFNNQRFSDPRIVELGSNFASYNEILFLNEHYPEYQSEFRYVLQDEGMLYYRLVLQLLDSNLEYLPFHYQMEDVIRSYQQFSWFEPKVNDFFGRINIIQDFSMSDFYSLYEKRHQVITTASDYFIKREKAIVGQYIRAITPQLMGSEDKEPFLELLLSELADHYDKYGSLMDEINQVSSIVICENEDFRSPYRNEFLPSVYEYCKSVGLISENQTEEEFISNFYERIEQCGKGEEVSFSNDWQAQKILEIFHYPISTRK